MTTGDHAIWFKQTTSYYNFLVKCSTRRFSTNSTKIKMPSDEFKMSVNKKKVLSGDTKLMASKIHVTPVIMNNRKYMMKLQRNFSMVQIPEKKEVASELSEAYCVVCLLIFFLRLLLPSLESSACSLWRRWTLSAVRMNSTKLTTQMKQSGILYQSSFDDMDSKNEKKSWFFFSVICKICQSLPLRKQDSSPIPGRKRRGSESMESSVSAKAVTINGKPQAYSINKETCFFFEKQPVEANLWRNKDRNINTAFHSVLSFCFIPKT